MVEKNIDSLLKCVAELKSKIQSSKKYGLVWDKEDVEEDVVCNCSDNISVLKSVPELTIKNGTTNHILIEGDNCHIFAALNGVKESLDALYIVSPYNAGEGLQYQLMSYCG